MKKLAIFILGISLLSGCYYQESSYIENPIYNSGKAGSTARFAIVNDHLITVGQSYSKLFKIAANGTLSELDQTNIWNAETVYPYGDNIFIGSTNGMFIYKIQNDRLSFVSNAEHFRSCDPVVAIDNYAYVTLNTNAGCGWNPNELHVYEISDIYNPNEVSVITLSDPYGLGVNDSLLFVCDDGIKVFDRTNPANLNLLYTENYDAFDVIVRGNVLLTTGKSGVNQFLFNKNGLNLISSISLPDEE